MMNIRIDRKSILFKMTGFVVILVIIQTLFLIGFLIFGGVLDQARDNALQSFKVKTQNRNAYLKSEMRNSWSNLSPYQQQISSKLSDEQDDEVFFRAAIDDLIDMLRATKTSGAFIILDGEGSDYPALYIRDYEPRLNDSSNKDLYMILGSPSIAKEQKIPLDRFWKYRMEFDSENIDFYQKPFSKATLTFNTELLGYWKTPFTLFTNDLPIMTYSLPLFDSNKKLRGVIGVEISVSYFSKYLPSNDLHDKDSLGYMVGVQEKGLEKINPVLMVGALQKRMISKNEVLDLSEIDDNRNIYVIENSSSEEQIYACIDEIGLYKANTPFENESWYLIGLMREDHLLSYFNRIKNILELSVLASIVIGILGGSVISYFFTQPITRLVNRVGQREKDKSVELPVTGFKEIDELLNAIEKANSRLLEAAVQMSKIIDLADFPIGAFEIRADSETVFVTEQFQAILDADDDTMNKIVQSKSHFTEYLMSMMRFPVEDEENVYKTGPGNEKYIRVKIVEGEMSTIGVIVVVSDEILGKNLIKEERDYDPLTKILNRKAVQLRIEQILINADPLKIAALVMFDLDNLKVINDSFGHRWGDIYIKKTVAALANIGKSKGILGRRSGDEFVLLLHGYSSRDEIVAEMNDFYDTLGQYLISFPDGSSKPLSISGGLLWVDSSTLEYEELLHQADQLLYAAKNENKGFYIEGHIDRKVELLSMKDALTGLYNRAYCDQIVEKEIARSIRNQNYITIIMVDIDLFKAFNDSSGIHLGDQCLINVAEVLKTAVNRPNDIIARYGDDEFCIMLPEVLPSGAGKISRSILHEIENKKILHRSSPLGVLSLSLGYVSLIPQGDDNLKIMIQKAEDALSIAKTKGHNNIEEFK